MKRRWFVVCPDTSNQRIVMLDKPVYQIGRSSEATLRVPSKNVSALHASLVLRGHAASLVDLDSTNGTTVNGVRTRTADLHDGDVVEMADIALVFHEEEVGEPARDLNQKTDTYCPVPGGIEVGRVRQIADAAVRAGGMDTAEGELLVESWESLQGMARRFDALHAILAHALRAPDRPELVRVVLTEIGALLRLDVVGLYLQDEGLFHILEGGRISGETKGTSVSQTLLDRVLVSGRPEMLENIGQDSSVLGFESLMQLKIQSILCLPVMPRAGQAVGVLYCVSRRSGELRLLERDRLFLSACSSAVALAIENLGQVEKTKEKAKAEERGSQQRRYSPVIHRLQQERDNLSLKLREPRPSTMFGMDHPVNRDLCAFVARSARADVPVLLLGETGVGKTALARHIHEQSRPRAPFVIVDCTAIAVELIESELFGHEKGAFTGAYFKKVGKIPAAENGTVFVDEIGDLSPKTQGKLLRLIESGEFEPVGSTRTQRSTARLVFATNRELVREVESKRFREDLFFRLNVLSHTVLPLRDRRELILPLAEHFLTVYAERTGGAAAITDAAREALLAHRWPGNVRELENAIMRALINAQGTPIGPEHLEIAEHSTIAPLASSEPAAETPSDLDLKSARERLDRDYLARALALCDHNISQAARKLNLSRNSLMDLMKKHGFGNGKVTRRQSALPEGLEQRSKGSQTPC